MVLKVSTRGQVPPFIVMDVMRAANAMEAAGEHVVHMEVGQPGTGAPKGVVDAIRRTVGTQTLGYTDAFGIPELRNRIARHYDDWYDIEVDPNRVVVTTGSSGAFVLSFLAAFDPGDRVALTSPGYPAYRNILAALGINVVDIPVGHESNFQPTVSALEAIQASCDRPIDGLIVASPSNPTGTMLKPEQLDALVIYCEREGIRLVSDEIYHGITFGVTARTALATSDQAIVINSFSKYFSMTGWRLGWMILPNDLKRAVECLGQNLYISPPTVSQMAGVAAFDCTDELEENVRRYAANRTMLIEELPRAGLHDLASSDGAFYIYADVGHLTSDSVAFCRRMLEESGVAATPGTDFDPSRGHRYVRFSFAGETNIVEQAVSRLHDWLT